jgi:hypothetical protein
MATELEGTHCRYVDTNPTRTVNVDTNPARTVNVWLWLYKRQTLRQYDKEIKCLVPEWLIHQTSK